MKVVKVVKEETPSRYLVRARHLHRKSRSDEGRLGVWIVTAPTELLAATIWHEHQVREHAGLYELESVALDTRPVVRLG